MRSLLVTGGAGFIGANFVHYWAAQYPDDRIVVLDALTYAGNQASLEAISGNPSYRFVHGDIGDPELVKQLLTEEKTDTIVHFAAESHVDRSIHEPDAFIQTNVIGTHSLLKMAREAWLDGDAAPASHLSKAASDHLVRSYHHTYGLRVTTSNCSNNYGPYQFPEKLIPLMIVNALSGKPLPIYGDGSNIRDWLYVEDHCRGIDLVMNKGNVGETYNIGGNNECSNLEIVGQICAGLDRLFAEDESLGKRFPDAPAARGDATESLITFVKDRPGHDWRYAIDATKANTELQYAPGESFTSGLQKTLIWMLANESWWRAVMDGSYRDWIDKNYAI
jgi:dTDP-glucose 4,6-dehydratase